MYNKAKNDKHIYMYSVNCINPYAKPIHANNYNKINANNHDDNNDQPITSSCANHHYSYPSICTHHQNAGTGSNTDSHANKLARSTRMHVCPSAHAHNHTRIHAHGLRTQTITVGKSSLTHTQTAYKAPSNYVCVYIYKPRHFFMPNQRNQMPTTTAYVLYLRNSNAPM